MIPYFALFLHLKWCFILLENPVLSIATDVVLKLSVKKARIKFPNDSV